MGNVDCCSNDTIKDEKNLEEEQENLNDESIQDESKNKQQKKAAEFEFDELIVYNKEDLPLKFEKHKPEESYARVLSKEEEKIYEPQRKIRKYIDKKFGNLNLKISEKVKNIPYSEDPYYIINEDHIYVGQWYQGRPMGIGRLFYLHEAHDTKKKQVQAIYEGFMKDGIPHGYGRRITNQLMVFEGSFNDGLLNGYGKFTRANGFRYEGQFKEGRPNGPGQETWPDGTMFVGNYIDGFKEGMGRIAWPIVELRKNKVHHHHQGSDQLKNNATPEQGVGATPAGTTVGGPAQKEIGTDLHAQGVITKQQEQIQESYNGGFRKNVFHGIGSYEWRDGRKYEGQWVDGRMEGYGRFTWKNGSYYEGQYKEDNKHGKGTFNFGNGWSYIGNWAMGKQHGIGIMEFKRPPKPKKANATPTDEVNDGLTEEEKKNPAVFIYSQAFSKVSVIFKKDQQQLEKEMVEKEIQKSQIKSKIQQQDVKPGQSNILQPNNLSVIVQSQAKQMTLEEQQKLREEEIENQLKLEKELEQQMPPEERPIRFIGEWNEGKRTKWIYDPRQEAKNVIQANESYEIPTHQSIRQEKGEKTPTKNTDIEILSSLKKTMNENETKSVKEIYLQDQYVPIYPPGFQERIQQEKMQQDSLRQDQTNNVAIYQDNDEKNNNNFQPSGINLNYQQQENTLQYINSNIQINQLNQSNSAVQQQSEQQKYQQINNDKDQNTLNSQGIGRNNLDQLQNKENSQQKLQEEEKSIPINNKPPRNQDDNTARSKQGSQHQIGSQQSFNQQQASNKQQQGQQDQQIKSSIQQQGSQKQIGSSHSLTQLQKQQQQQSQQQLQQQPLMSQQQPQVQQQNNQADIIQFSNQTYGSNRMNFENTIPIQNFIQDNQNQKIQQQQQPPPSVDIVQFTNNSLTSNRINKENDIQQVQNTKEKVIF